MTRDPFPYDGPLRRVDGTAPFNHYLWPMPGDWYWANQSLDRRFPSRWEFCVVALNDGTWLARGFVWETAYPTREAALRVAAARMLRTARAARRWPRWPGNDRLEAEDFAQLVKWTFEILRRDPPPIRQFVAALPTPWADLPLFNGGRP